MSCILLSLHMLVFTKLAAWSVGSSSRSDRVSISVILDMCSPLLLECQFHIIFSRPRRSQSAALYTLFWFIHWFIPWVTYWLFVKISLLRGHAKLFRDGASSHKIEYDNKFQEIINLKGHQIAILVQKWHQFSESVYFAYL